MSFVSWDPGVAPPARETDADRLIRHACLDYGAWQPERLADAHALLAAQPALAQANLATAATVGDVATVRALLAAGADANAVGGPFPWPPLLYACYSRLPIEGERSTLEVARVLLAAGADAKAGFLCCGNLPPFTALTGAFGRGEHGNNHPPHPARLALARLLLDAGADANDGQTLYNCHFVADDSHLELLFEYGLSDRELLREELWAAAQKNFAHRVNLLLAHGAPVDEPGRRDGRTPAHAALRYGNHEIANTLLAHGAKPPTLTDDDKLAAACVAGRVVEADELLVQLGPPAPHVRAELVRRAVEANHPEGVRFMASVGFSVDGLAQGRTPMHEAAWAGDVAMVQLLVELGANPEVRDLSFNSTPLGWAQHNKQAPVVAYLASVTG
jgi:ankyrin repeat protein